jgi:hypothetical protein
MVGGKEWFYRRGRRVLHGRLGGAGQEGGRTAERERKKGRRAAARGKISRREKKPLTDALTHTHTHTIGKHAANTHTHTDLSPPTSADLRDPLSFFFFLVNIYI